MREASETTVGYFLLSYFHVVLGRMIFLFMTFDVCVLGVRNVTEGDLLMCIG